MEASTEVRLDLVILLLIYYAVYVVGDLSTTHWLILNDPYGVSHEANPIGVALYQSRGVLGLLLGKMATFVPLVLMVIVFEARFRSISWFRETTETVVLGLITYSLVILLNNFTAIIIIQVFRGEAHLLRLFPVIKGLILILSISLAVVLLRARGHGGLLRATETIIGTAAMVGPLLLYDPLFRYLGENMWTLLAYTLAMFTIIGAFFYVIEEIVRERRHLGV